MTEEGYKELADSAPFQTISYDISISLFENKDIEKDIERGQRVYEEELELINKHRRNLIS